MRDQIPDKKRLSRRDWMRIVSAGGLAATVTGVTHGFSKSVDASTSTQDGVLEGFLADLYSQRAQAATTKDVESFDKFYDTDNNQLISYERERSAFMNDIGARWNGTLLDYNSSVSLIDLQDYDEIVIAKLYETIRVLWIPTPRAPSSARRKRQQQDPSLATMGIARGNRGEITSSLGIQHEVKLTKHESGWRVLEDAYEEPDLYGASPSPVPGSWAAVILGKPSNSTMKLPPMPKNAPNAMEVSINGTGTYNRSGAQSHALNHCINYDTRYCNYNPCDGDCANFVSQCLEMGGQVGDNAWNRFTGACGNCGTTALLAGTYTWANNKFLQEWIINTGRGISEDTIDALDVGDVVNYDWSGDGRFDHATIVVDGTDGNTLICSHNADRCSVPWEMGGAVSYLYTRLYSTYSF